MRGSTLIWTGLGAIGISLFMGMLIEQAAISAIRGGPPTGMRGDAGVVHGGDFYQSSLPGHRRQDVMGKLQALSFFAAITNLLFYGGIIAVIVGIVLLASQPQQPPLAAHSTMAAQHAGPPPAPQGEPELTVEEENRRLRAELQQMKQQSAGEETV